MADKPQHDGGLRVEAWDLLTDGRGGLGDSALAISGLVLVDDALAHGLVELAARLARSFGGLVGIAGSGGLIDATDRRLEFALDRLIALVTSVIGLVALDLGLDVCHYSSKVCVLMVCCAGFTVHHYEFQDNENQDNVVSKQAAPNE